MGNSALLIAFHFPPFFGSSGNLRTLSFARHLPEFGWEPVLLTANARAYPKIDDHLLKDVPDGLEVHRAFALDVRKHLSIRGAYAAWMAQPDRWSSWWLGAVPMALSLIRRHRIKVIWSTYPIATAHLIGYTLHRLTGLPWVADFRDPMNSSDVGGSGLTTAIRGWVDRKTIETCQKTVFTTPGAMRAYAEQYPGQPGSKWIVIPNGYEEDHFASLGWKGRPQPVASSPITLVHSGHLYRDERDPRPFFSAVSKLKMEGVISSGALKIVFRASGHEDYYQKCIAEHQIQDIVELAPPVSYQDALAEMCSADGLIIFQGAACNRQIPAKLYEYMRVQCPIFALTDPGGDTAAELHGAGIDTISRLNDADDIALGLQRFIRGIREGTAPIASRDDVLKHSRRSRSALLASVFDDVA